jgi:hypothetical protein
MWTRQGKIGAALECDGTDDYVDVTSFAGNYDALTVEAWIKTPGTNDGGVYDRIVHRWLPGFILCVTESASSDGRLRMYLWDDAEDSLTGNTAISDDQWHHVVSTWNKTGGEIKLYVDGKLDNSKTGSSVNTTIAINGTLGISTTGTVTFKGLIDDVRIYNYARTAAQILVDYNAGSAAHLGAGTDPNEGNPPIGYWSFDENTGTVPYDRSGNGNNGTFASSPVWAQGKFGACLDFDGTDDSVNLGSGAVLRNNTSMTVSLWFNADIVRQSCLVRWFNGYSPATENNVGIYSDKKVGATYYLSGTLRILEGPLVTQNRWYYVTVTITDGAQILYVDGIEVARNTFAGTLDTSTAATLINSDYYRGYTNYFDGKIDEVKLYAYARSAAQIAYDYSRGAPVAHYKFDEGGATIAHNEYSSADTGAAPVGWWRMDNNWNDASGNGNNGTATGATFSSLAKIGPYCGNFDGNDHVSCSNVTGFTSIDDIGSNVTIEAWVKCSNITPHTTILATEAFRFQVGSGGRFLWEWTNGTNTSGTHGTGGQIPQDQWTHMAGVKEGNTTKLYVNGVYLMSVTNQYSRTITNLEFGRDTLSGIGAADYYPGFIDDVRIYNYSRTAEQIYNDYKTTHGTLVGDTKFVDGKVGKALQFDGTGDYVDCGTNLTDSMESAGTIEMWAYPTALGGLFSRSVGGSWTDERIVLHFYASGGKPDLTLSNGTNYWQHQANTAIPTGQWSYIAVTWDGSNVKHYLNGVLDRSQAQGGTPEVTGIKTWIGRTEGLAPDLFTGKLDDVRIYNYARTAAQIMQDYTQGAARLGAQAAGVADPWGGALPVGWWTMDENTGVLAYDASGNGNNGTISGATWTQGKNGPALSFDGDNDSSYVNSFTLTGATAVTVEAWIYPTAYSTTSQVGSDHGVFIDSSGIFFYTFHTGYLYFRFVDSANNYKWDGIAIPLNQWMHIVGTYDTNTVKYYKNGVLVHSYSMYGNPLKNISGLCIGRTDTNCFHGIVDDVKIYNYARTQAQIAWDYNRGKPVGHWRFNEGSGTTAYDESDNNNDGTITIGATGSQTTIGAAWTNGATGKFGKCMSFDGTDDKVETSSSSIFDLSNSDVTLSAWIKPSSVSSDYHGIVGTDYVHVLYRNGNRIYFGVYGSTAWIFLIASNTTIQAGQWYHVVGTYDHSYPKIYINSKLDITGNNYTANAVSGNRVVRIGLENSGSYYFDGLIDDVRIYNYARTAEQILQDYNAGAAARLGD